MHLLISEKGTKPQIAILFRCFRWIADLEGSRRLAWLTLIHERESIYTRGDNYLLLWLHTQYTNHPLKTLLCFFAKCWQSICCYFPKKKLNRGRYLSRTNETLTRMATSMFDTRALCKIHMNFIKGQLV